MFNSHPSPCSNVYLQCRPEVKGYGPRSLAYLGLLMITMSMGNGWLGCAVMPLKFV